MVEPQPSKLVVRVRFPSPALNAFEQMVNNQEGGKPAGFLPVRGQRRISSTRKGDCVKEEQSNTATAAVAQSVECVLGKDEVMGSNPISSF